MRAILLGVVVLAVVQSIWKIHNGRRVDVDPAANQVVLYSTASCAYCEQARQLLRRYGIAFTEYDIERSAEGRRQFEILQGRGVPLLIVNDTLLHGYDPHAVVRALR